MLVDTLLKMIGDNPDVYVQNSDKWISVSSYVFVSSFIYFPIVFGLLPLVYLFIKRKEYKKDKKQFIKKLILYPIVGAMVGCFVLYSILGLFAGLAARGLYGG